MIFFLFDTSAAVKRYKQEPGTEVVSKLLILKRGRVFLPSVCIPEIVAVFESLHHVGDERPDGRRIMLTRGEADTLRQRFIEDLTQKVLWPLDLDQARCWQSYSVQAVFYKTPLRAEARGIARERIDALDALVIGMALDLKNMFRDNLFLVASDGHMLDVAAKLHIKTIDPARPARHNFLL